MPPKNAPKGAISQERVFYTDQWTKEVDRKFIDVLVKQTVDGYFRVGANNAHAILTAMAEVNQQFQTNFAYQYCVERTKKLHKRYKVFNWIIHLSGVYYNPFSNTVQCNQELWDWMCREEKLAMAYMIKGESDFDGLKCIFQEGNDSDSGMEDHEVIEISSDTEVKAEEIHVPDNTILAVATNENNEANTDNSFWNELAWYASDSASEASLINEFPVGSVLSTTADVKSNKGKDSFGDRPTNRCPSVDTPSSSASYSPFKKV